MDEFTFFDFETRKRGSRLSRDQFAISYKKGNYYVCFNREITNEVINKQFNYLRIRRDNIIGDLHFVFNNEEKGCKIKIMEGSKCLMISNKDMVICLVTELGIKDFGRYTLRLTGNVSNTPSYLTYKIIKPTDI